MNLVTRILALIVLVGTMARASIPVSSSIVAGKGNLPDITVSLGVPKKTIYAPSSGQYFTQSENDSSKFNSVGFYSGYSSCTPLTSKATCTIGSKNSTQSWNSSSFTDSLKLVLTQANANQVDSVAVTLWGYDMKGNQRTVLDTFEIHYVAPSTDVWSFKDFNGEEASTGLIAGTTIAGVAWANADQGGISVSKALPAELGLADGWAGDSLAVVQVNSTDYITNAGVLLSQVKWQPMDLRHTTLKMTVMDGASALGGMSLAGWDIRVQLMSSYLDAKIKGDSGITLGFNLSNTYGTTLLSSDAPRTLSFLMDTASYPSWTPAARYPKAVMDSILATVTGINISFYNEEGLTGTGYFLIDDIQFVGVPTTGPGAPAHSARPVSPHSGATGVEQGITFQWLRGATDGTTQFQLAKTADFSDVLFDTLVEQDYSRLIYASELELNTKHYWRIRSLAAGGWADWVVDSFTMVNPPLARPVVVTPSQGQGTWKIRYPFKWNAVTGVDSIRVQVAKGADFSGALAIDTIFASPADTSFTPRDSVLGWKTSYSVRIKATAVNGDYSAFSKVVGFTTMPSPPADTILTLVPSGIAVAQDTTLLLSGTYVSQDTSVTDSIHIQVTKATDANFAAVVLDTVLKQGMTITTGTSSKYVSGVGYVYYPYKNYAFSLNIAGLSYGTSYSWRACPKNATDNGAWKKTLFKTATTSLTKITMINPTSNAGNVPRDIVPAWTVNGTTAATDSILLQVSRSPSFAGKVWGISTGKLDTGYVYTLRALLSTASDSALYQSFHNYSSGLDTTAKYYWRARRRAGNGNYSLWVVDSFTTMFGAPQQTKEWLIAPNTSNTSIASNGYNVSSNATLVWNKVVRSDSFEVLVFKPSKGYTSTRLWDGCIGSGCYTYFPKDTTYHAIVADTVAAISGLSNDSSYIWTVRPKSNVSGWGSWFARDTTKNTRSYVINYGVQYGANFTVVPAAPVVPVLLSPVGGVDTVSTSGVTLKWSDASTKIDSFVIQLSSTRNFTSNVLSQTNKSSYTYGSVPSTSAIFNGLDNLTQYFWRVKAGNAGGFSSWVVDSFVTKVGLPSAPSLLGPANNAADIQLNQTLSWSTSKAATKYNVEVSTEKLFVSAEKVAFSTTTTSTNVAGLVNSKIYFWRVNAENSVGKSVWSVIDSFTTVGLPPATPLLAAPVNGATNASVGSTLKWHVTARADSFRVQLSSSASFMSNLMDTIVVDTSVKSGSSLDNGVTYFWRVKASNKGGASSWSDVDSFTTIVASPIKPVGVLPTDGATGVSVSPIIRWNKARFATGYEIQLATNLDFTAIVGDATTKDTAVAMSGLSFLTKYYWRVQSRNSGGVSVWSAIDSFTTLLGVPSAPALLTPVSGASVAISAPFVWNRNEYTDSYKFQLATTSTFDAASLFKDTAMTDTSLKTMTLANSTTYYWRVNATNATGTSGWSTVASFTTIVPAPDVPVPFSPKNGVGNIVLNPVLSWNPTTWADSVRVQLSTSSSFATISVDSVLGGKLTNLQAKNLAAFSKYYWRAGAKNVAGTSAWSATFAFTTIDTTKPVIVNVPDARAAFTDKGMATAQIAWTAPTASDLAGIASLTSNVASGSLFHAGVTTVTYTATDSAGNVSSASFNVTVSDTEMPVIKGVPANVLLSAASSASVTWVAPTANDNVGIKTFTSSHASGEVFPIGKTVVLLVATDSAGNTANDSFVVEVKNIVTVSINGPKPTGVATSKILAANAPHAFANRPTVNASQGYLGIDGSCCRQENDCLGVDVALPGAGEITVAIFDNLGVPVIHWNEHVTPENFERMQEDVDGRRIANLRWDMRTSAGRSVPAGVYLWKVLVNARDGQKLEAVYRLGVKQEEK
jgi:HYR domain